VGPLAAHQGAAVLLTTPAALPDVTAAQIESLAPSRVVAVGGTIRISEESLQGLRDEGMEVTRIAGATRYETAALVAEGFAAADVVYLASGEELADALGGGAAAARAGSPLLLTRAGGLPAETVAQIERLAPREVVILGGHSRIPAASEEELRALVDGVVITRLAGADRYSTSALIAAHGWPTARGALLANGNAPVDAVAGTQFAAYRGDPVVLTRQSCQPDEVATALGTMGTQLHFLLGGRSVLDDGVATTTC
jgi:putative cell wall-binding protein